MFLFSTVAVSASFQKYFAWFTWFLPVTSKQARCFQVSEIKGKCSTHTDIGTHTLDRMGWLTSHMLLSLISQLSDFGVVVWLHSKFPLIERLHPYAFHVIKLTLIKFYCVHLKWRGNHDGYWPEHSICSQVRKGGRSLWSVSRIENFPYVVHTMYRKYILRTIPKSLPK